MFYYQRYVTCIRYKVDLPYSDEYGISLQVWWNIEMPYNGLKLHLCKFSSYKLWSPSENWLVENNQ